MKKFLLVMLILFFIFSVYIVYDNYINKGIPKLKVEEEAINIDNIFIYGTHLNFSGNLVNDNNLDIVLYNGEFIEYKINIDNDSSSFNLSNNINDGIFLDDIPVGKYYVFLRSNTKDMDDKEKHKYYILKNTTDYKEMIYYTLSNKNNKITINNDDEYKTLMLNVLENKDREIYDIVIDPGHGGKDSGANKNGYYEKDLTMKIALNLKQKFENNGVKVKLTREENQLSNNEKLNDYGIHGRAVIPYEVNSKFLLSIHLNSNYYSYVNGIELYTPANINYDFIKNVANNIHENAKVNYSSNKINKVFDGIYTRVFTDSDIEKSKKDFLEKNMNPYDITTKSNYYFMIRETGGIMTGAYVDDRNKEIGYNPYVKSNIGAEAYLMELGYLSNKDELNNVINNIDKYTDAIVNSFINYLNIK